MLCYISGLHLNLLKYCSHLCCMQGFVWGLKRLTSLFDSLNDMVENNVNFQVLVSRRLYVAPIFNVRCKIITKLGCPVFCKFFKYVVTTFEHKNRNLFKSRKMLIPNLEVRCFACECTFSQRRSCTLCTCLASFSSAWSICLCVRTSHHQIFESDIHTLRVEKLHCTYDKL